MIEVLDDGDADRAARPLLDDLVRRVTAAVCAATERVEALDGAAVAEGAAAVEVVAVCEAVVRIAQGLQADAVQELDTRRREVAGPEVHERDLCRSLVAEIAMARRTSSTAGESTYRLAHDLVDHPAAHALLRDGEVNQAVVAAVCRETVFLDPAMRTQVDAELAPMLPGLGPKRAAVEARRLVLDHEPHAAYARTIRAREERHVWLRPELDAMATLTVYAPAEVLVPAWKRLSADAAAPVSPDDGRTSAQRACDRAVELLTGATIATDGHAAGVTAPGVEIGVLMRPETLFGADDSSAVLHGYGPVPGKLARELASRGRSWVRRFFTTPDGRAIEGVDPRRRRFPADVARMIRAADELCSRPWCECRTREVDHTVPYARGGPTTPENADGTCRTDNLLKETRGWRVERDTAGVRTWTTPTGHAYRSPHVPFALRIDVGDAPIVPLTRMAPPGSPPQTRPTPPPPASPDSPMEAALARLIADQAG